MVNKQKDIIWILLDGMRIDYLKIGNQQKSKKHYIETLLLQGRLYTDIISAAKFTTDACYALGTGLYSSVNGVIGNSQDHSKERHYVVYAGDYLKSLGYHTFFYGDELWRGFPSSGIDIFEFSDYMGITSLPGLSFDIPRRRQLLKSFRNADSPKFLYLHLMTLHGISPLMSFLGRKRGQNVWTSEGYRIGIQWLARDLRIVLKQLELTGEELLVISSDHGIILDEDYISVEFQEGLAMRQESFRTFCSFISSDITPRVINERFSSIDILPTIFELANLPAIPVQGNSLISTAGTAAPISEGVGYFGFPFDRACVKARSIYEGEWKLVIKSGGVKELYRIKDGLEKEVVVSDYPYVVKHLASKLYSNLSTSANEVRNKKITEFKSQGKKVLSLNREDLPARIVLFMLDNDMDYFYSFVCDLKAQIEHYFDLHIFNRGECLPKNLSDLDPRINVHNEELRVETINKILGTYVNKPEFVGFVKSSIGYYDDYLYRLRRLLETNPQADIACANLKNGSISNGQNENCENPRKDKITDSVFLARIQLFERLIEQGKGIEELLLLPKHDRNYLKVESEYPLGTCRKKKIAVCPLDESTIELLKAEGIKYTEPERLDETKEVDVFACTNIENVQTAQELAELHQAIAVYIDYDISSTISKVIPSKSLVVVKRLGLSWNIMDSEIKIALMSGGLLWEALEECVIKEYLCEKDIKIKNLIKIIKILMTVVFCLPILRSYSVRKLLLLIRIGKIKLFSEKTKCKRKIPYNKYPIVNHK
jgi:hypothetical protein